MDYKEKLNWGFSEFLKKYSDNVVYNSYSLKNKKLLFLSKDIFDFDTNSFSYNISFSSKMMAVILAIHNKTVFDYIEKNEENYLLMTHTYFLKERIIYDNDVRDAQFDNSVVYYLPGVDENIENLSEFFKDLLEWFEEK